MKHIVNIASHMQTMDAGEKLAKPIVNWLTAVIIDNHIDAFKKHESLSKGLKSWDSFISDTSIPFDWANMFLYDSVENSLSFRLTITNVCKDNRNEPTDIKPENKYPRKFF
ncbi:hypothetical protein [Serratia liquefaciens]|uniref:hypothetical protein n=1 Tax=Serratia liquefaciens TaxID=614 RepID=UPI0003584ADB|nr:hypothetical protein [Serratia liquefaciens]AGQ32459.1 hypothetical protein M495_19020 [Serratia liquefaciens ATCC 27592]